MSSTGQTLGGRYRLGARLGQGGMGTVYEATQEDLGRRVAVKVLDERLAEDHAQIERFRREALAAAALGHPNIVAVTDFGWDPPEPPFLVMEYLTGQSLARLLEVEGSLPPERVAFILAQVLSALAAAHAEGMVHRDVKPDNVFLVSGAPVPDFVKVLDFGIAKLGAQSAAGARLTSTGAMLGTPAYMAPEQARGADVDARADIYAVGATLYQALSGRLPFEEPSLQAMLFAIVEKTPPSLAEVRPDLPPELVAVVDRAMAKDRAGRYSSAEEMRAALAPWAPVAATQTAAGLAPDVAVNAPTMAVAGATPAPASPVVVRSNPKAPVSAQPTPVASSASSPPSRGRSSAATIVLGIVAGLVAITAIVMGSLVMMARARNARDAAEDSVRPEREVTSAASASATIATVAPSASAVPSAIDSAPSATASSAPPPRPRPKVYGGKTAFMSSTNFGDCPGCGWKAYRDAVQGKVAAIDACFAASVHEPPVHEYPQYKVSVAADGTIQDVQPLGGDSAPGLDRCLGALLRHTPLSKSTGGAGSFSVGFTGRCRTFECR